jgi:hypothetical protein
MITDPQDEIVELFEKVIVLGLQLLIAVNPELLLAHEDLPSNHSPRVRHAREIVDLARDLHRAIDRYRDHACISHPHRSDIPF